MGPLKMRTATKFGKTFIEGMKGKIRKDESFLVKKNRVISMFCLPLCQSSEDFDSILVAYKEFPVCYYFKELDEYFHIKKKV